MKLTISLAAAVLFLSATAASASPIATTTDEARAMAGRALPAAEATSVGSPAGPATTTDEARAIAGRSLPGSSPVVLTGSRIASTTDEARALAGGAVRAAAPPMPGNAATACHQACTCKHG